MDNFKSDWDMDKKMKYLNPSTTNINYKSYLYMPNPCYIGKSMKEKMNNHELVEHFMKIDIIFKHLAKLKERL
jgi:hypothetical protein